MGESGPLGASDPIGSRTTNATLTGGPVNFVGTALTAATHTITNAEHGLIVPSFTMDGAALNAGENISVSIALNGNEVGTIRFDDSNVTGDTIQLTSFPHVREGDVLTYSLSGNGTTDFSFSTDIIDDDNAANLTADLQLDGAADMFEEDSNIDANEWVYRNDVNTNFNWYCMRAVPDVVSTSIEVFDSQGGRHNVEARYFRIGTKTEPASAARINSWDMMINIPPGDGVIIDDLVTGIEFDQLGRFTGSIGTTIHNTTLNATTHVGSPATANIQIDWAATGPTDPATIRTNFGTNNSTDGLTGFGTASTAAAVEQDGFTDGRLDNLTVSAEGDIIALYTNGISRQICKFHS